MAAQDADIKLLNGLTKKFIVDGFNFTRSDCTCYFLTHYHSDHTTGLNAGFKCGKIYTSKITRDLLVHDMGVRPELVFILRLNETTLIEGIEVTAIDAFHCPGAIMLHFFDPKSSINNLNPSRKSSSIGHRVGLSVLHVGDFRADDCVVQNQMLSHNLSKYQGLDILYLDTTYCNPKYTFPPQGECLVSLFNTVKMERVRRPTTLFAISTYSIGKEKVVIALALAAKGKVLVSENKKRMLRLCGYWNMNLTSLYAHIGITSESPVSNDRIFTTDEKDPDIAVVVTRSTNHDALREVLLTLPDSQRQRFDTVVGFRATGWTHSKSKTNINEFGLKKPWVQNYHDPLVKSDDNEVVILDDDTLLIDEDDDGAHEEDDGVFQVEDSFEEENSLTDPEDVIKTTDLHETSEVNEITQANIETRMYSIPYSEHSSFSELINFVTKVKPRIIVPTVNETGAGSGTDDVAKGRKWLVDTYFVNLMDLSNDRSRLDSYFSGAKSSFSSTSSIFSRSSSVSSLTTSKKRSSSLPLEKISFFAPKKKLSLSPSLLRSCASSDSANSIEISQDAIDNLRSIVCCGAGTSISNCFIKKSRSENLESRPTSEVDMIEILDSDDDNEVTPIVNVTPIDNGTDAYLRRLLMDANGSVEVAVSIHFGPNRGEINHHHFKSSHLPHMTTSSSLSTTSPRLSLQDSLCEDEKNGEDYSKINCFVYGSDSSFSHFASKEKAIKRLEQLGVRVMLRRTPKTTHLLLGTKTAIKAVPFRILHGSSPPPQLFSNDGTYQHNDQQNSSTTNVPISILSESWLLRAVKFRNGDDRDRPSNVDPNPADQPVDLTTRTSSMSTVSPNMNNDKKSPSQVKSKKRMKTKAGTQTVENEEEEEEEATQVSSKKKNAGERSTPKVTIKQITAMARLLCEEMKIIEPPPEARDDNVENWTTPKHNEQLQRYHIMDDLGRYFHCVIKARPYCSCSGITDEQYDMVSPHPVSTHVKADEDIHKKTKIKKKSRKPSLSYIPCAHLAFVFVKVLGLNYRECSIPFLRELNQVQLQQLVAARTST